MSPKPHLYFHTPTPIFKARVNMPTPTYPANSLDFDGVTLGAYTDVQFDMTLLLGTTDGADDLGRVRVKSGEVDNIRIARTSRGVEDGTLNIQDNAYITVLGDDFRLWARLPRFMLDNEGDVIKGTDFKDGNIEPGDYNTNIPPIANTGPWVADYIDPDTGLATFEFPAGGASLSVAMADGATIATYDWDVKDGTITVGSSSTAVITATFPAGFRWIALTVTDSNGKPHTSRCAVLAVDKDDDPTIKNFKLSQRMEKSGQTLDIELYEDAPRTTYPDGTLVLFWLDAPFSPTEREHMKFCGWVANENYAVARGKTGLRKTTTIHCEDIAVRLSSLPGFPQALERETSDSLWSVMPSLDMHKALVYLYYWHCTAMSLADFILPDGLRDYDTVRLDASGASLFDQMNGQANKVVPDHYMTCNTKGQMVIRRDWMLDDLADRPEVDYEIIVEQWNNLQANYNRKPKVHVLRSGAVLVSTDFVTIDGEVTVPTVYSIAPGDAQAFGQGMNEANENEGLTLSQADLNTCEGHRYARLNARYEPFTFTDPTGRDFWNYEPAEMKRVQLNMTAALAAQRGLDFTEAAGQIKEISVNYEVNQRGMAIKANVSWEKESVGFDAVTFIPPDSEGSDFEPVTPPSDGLTPTAGWLAGITQEGILYRTFDFGTPAADGGPTWESVDLGITDAKLYSFVVDPFSPGYLATGVSPVNAWVVGETNIWRVQDMFGFATAITVHTFATSLNTSDVVQTRTVQASFGEFFTSDNPWIVVISNYNNASGHTGVWATYSVDAGNTWSTEVAVSSSTPGSSIDNPIGVYTSPKTPGLVYTAAWLAGSVSEAMKAAWGTSTGSGNYTFSDDVEISGTASQSGGSGTTALSFMPHPPDDAVRIEIYGTYSIEAHRVSFTNPSAQLQALSGGVGGNTVSVTFSSFGSSTIVTATSGSPNVSESASFHVTMELTSGAWPHDRLEVIGTPLTGPAFPQLKLTSATGSTGSASGTLTARITEIELLGGTIYNPTPVGTDGFVSTDYGAIWTAVNSDIVAPGSGLAASLHFPWPENLDEAVAYYGRIDVDTVINYITQRASAGIIEDVSPTNAGIKYGVGRFGFGVRTYDSDRIYAVLGGVGNDTTASTADNKYCVFVSEDGGDVWTKVLGPLTVSDFTGLKGYGVAFSGTDRNVLYVWGPKTASKAIQYSDDFGATFDDRSGDLPSITGFLGIAGGPNT